jgi:hypothetical protein
MNFLIQSLGIYLPIFNIYSNITKEQPKYINWCIYLINSIILNYLFSNINILIQVLVLTRPTVQLCQAPSSK